jgi:hypothetical protein
VAGCVPGKWANIGYPPPLLSCVLGSQWQRGIMGKRITRLFSPIGLAATKAVCAAHRNGNPIGCVCFDWLSAAPDKRGIILGALK